MAEIGTTKISAARDLVRDIDSTFDTNASIVGGFVAGFTYGIPIEVIETRGKLLEGIAGIWTSPVSAMPPEWLEQENAQLRAEIYTLKQRMQTIEERLEIIEATIPKEKVVVLREISKEQATEEILRLFTTEQKLYYSDIAKQLKLDLKLIVEICNELQQKGEIEVVDDTLQSR
jgi:vacuolar-type H+-ATPase subunit I/STV1